jgi:hypothetical protein
MLYRLKLNHRQSQPTRSRTNVLRLVSLTSTVHAETRRRIDAVETLEGASGRRE